MNPFILVLTTCSFSALGFFGYKWLIENKFSELKAYSYFAVSAGFAYLSAQLGGNINIYQFSVFLSAWTLGCFLFSYAENKKQNEMQPVAVSVQEEISSKKSA